MAYVTRKTRQDNLLLCWRSRNGFLIFEWEETPDEALLCAIANGDQRAMKVRYAR
jgi:hypothetical protein